MNVRDIADAFIEAPIVTSFTRIGYESRRRLDQWTRLDDYNLAGRVIVLTGATSGLGKAAATQLAKCGATLVLVGRNPERNQTVVTEMIEATGNDAITQVPADLGDYDQVRALAASVLSIIGLALHPLLAASRRMVHPGWRRLCHLPRGLPLPPPWHREVAP